MGRLPRPQCGELVHLSDLEQALPTEVYGKVKALLDSGNPDAAWKVVDAHVFAEKGIADVQGRFVRLDENRDVLPRFEGGNVVGPDGWYLVLRASDLYGPEVGPAYLALTEAGISPRCGAFVKVE